MDAAEATLKDEAQAPPFDWQGEEEVCARPIRGEDEVALLAFGVCAGDGQSQARTPGAACPGGVSPVEAVEDAFPIRGVDPGPVVGDLEADLTARMSLEAALSWSIHAGLTSVTRAPLFPRSGREMTRVLAAT